MASKELSEVWTAEEFARFIKLGIEPTREGRGQLVPTPPKPDNSEACFRSRVVKLAEDAGWLCYYLRDSRDANTSGFPDLVMVKPAKFVATNKIIFAELKVGRNQPSGEQCEWLQLLDDSHGTAYLWHPEDLVEIERLLTR